MLIKCPKCSTGYNIPDDKLDDKPTKMRCARCKTVFAISKRGGNVPTGYAEFTGAQSALPSEFAFLKQSEKKPNPDPVPPAKPEPPPTHAAPEAPPSAPTPSPTGTTEREPNLNSAGDGGTTEPHPSDEQMPRVNVALTREDEPAQAETASPADTQRPSPNSPLPPQKQPRLPPPADPSPPSSVSIGDDAASRGSSLGEIFGAQPAWEVAAPLDLGSYEVESKTRSQIAGKIMAAIVAIVAAFFIFVAYRNGWNLSFANLGTQVAFAFSDREFEIRPHEVESIEVIVENTRVLKRKKKSPLLVVSGTVFNNATTRRSNIILRGQLRNPSGEVLEKTRCPCGVESEDTHLRKLKKGRIAGLYHERGKLYNCSMLPESNRSFQLVFEKVPPTFDPSYEIEVVAVSADIGSEL